MLAENWSQHCCHVSTRSITDHRQTLTLWLWWPCCRPPIGRWSWSAWERDAWWPCGWQYGPPCLHPPGVHSREAEEHSRSFACTTHMTPSVLLHECVGEWADTTVVAKRKQLTRLFFTYMHLQARQRYSREGYTRRWAGVRVCRLYTIAQLF